MTGAVMGMVAIIAFFCILMAVLGRLRRQVGGGLGPTEMSDGSITASPTGYPEEMSGHGKTISSTDNNAAKY